MSSPGGRERRPRSSRRPPSRLSLRVEESDRGQQLAAFCVQRGGISLEEARASIQRGGAYVNGKRIHDAEHLLVPGESVELHLRERGEAPHAEALSGARILHLDAQLIAIDKPAGVLAQEGLAGGPDLPSLTSALLASRGESMPALLVHRLDRGTTGVTLLARTRTAQSALLEAFRGGLIEKEYLALCALPTDRDGSELADEFVVDLALGADERIAGNRKPDPQGDAARTRFRVLERWPGVALIAAFPETGRTHQIRVHLAANGLPLLGDARYGGPRQITRPDGARLDLTRPMLHARALTAPHPAGGRLHVEAPRPADLLVALEFLSGSLGT